MMPKVPPKQPVFYVTNGTQIMLLIARLKEYTEEWDQWHKENAYKSPWQARSTIAAYKVALVHNLIFFREVNTHELALTLAKSNSDKFNRDCYEKACIAVERILQE